MDSLTNTFPFELSHIHVRFGILDACVRGDCFNIQFGEGSQCLGLDGWLTTITVGCPKVPLQIPHNPGKIV